MTRRPKTTKPSPEQLEAQADAILRQAERGEKVLGEITKATSAITETLERIHQELLAPRNDPEYVRRLEEADARRNQIANEVGAIHLFPDGNETWIGVSINNRRDQAKAIEVGRQMAEHFEAKLFRHDASVEGKG